MSACSFCDKTKREVRLLAARQDTGGAPYICDECVGLCLSMMTQAEVTKASAEHRGIRAIEITISTNRATLVRVEPQQVRAVRFDEEKPPARGSGEPER